MQELSGKQLFHAFRAGSSALIQQRDLLNKMNVFPVADGDTGSNMSGTVLNALENASPQESFGNTLRSIADGVLQAARGNSGLLFAQFINGWSDAVGELKALDKDHLVRSTKLAVASAYASMNEPVEGTMLTVMREWSEKLESENHLHQGVSDLLLATLQSAHQSLVRTKEKLAVLKKANLVDAGAKGFVEFLDGFVMAIKRMVQHPHEAMEDRAPEVELEHANEFDHQVHPQVSSLDDIPHRFCTECMVKGAELDLSKLRQDLQEFGDSLIVAGGKSLVRVHIHTNQAAKTFAYLSKHGLVSGQKVDDMHVQYKVANQKHKTIGILTDSTCDIPDALLLKHTITMVPLTVNFGDQAFLDRLSLDADYFFAELAHNKHFPQTSMPSPAMFEKSYQFLFTHYQQVLAVHISAKLSGTWQASKTAANRLSSQRVVVVNSRSASAAMGLCILRAAQAIEDGQSFEAVQARLNLDIDRVSFFVIVPTLDNFVRGGRLSKSKALIAGLLKLKPIISTDKHGAAIVIGKGFGQQGALAKIKKIIAKQRAPGQAAPSGIYSWALVHGNCADKAHAIALEIETLIGKKPVFIDQISPVLGAHAGPGAINIALLPQ